MNKILKLLDMSNLNKKITSSFKMENELFVCIDYDSFSYYLSFTYPFPFSTEPSFSTAGLQMGWQLERFGRIALTFCIWS